MNWAIRPTDMWIPITFKLHISRDVIFGKRKGCNWDSKKIDYKGVRLKFPLGLI